MGRPPCCDKIGIKKGPWTPEEDIILVSYIQEHGPGNWRSVPTNTGLMRCSKSCRLRWTNYLRPGIKRGNFTTHEEGMIIHLQALLGNKWAAIASYLPQRTDNDIKNYWNTHLKKKLKKFQATGLDSQCLAPSDSNTYQLSWNSSASKLLQNNQNSSTSSSSTLYASSTENISRLLEGWMRSSPNLSSKNIDDKNLHENHQNKDDQEVFKSCGSSWLQDGGSKNTIGGAIIPTEYYKSVISEKSACDQRSETIEKGCTDNPPPFTYLEKWLLDESAAHVEELMELPTIFT